MKRKIKTAISKIALVFFLGWFWFSGAEVSAHNNAMLYGKHHQYSEWNLFVIGAELFDTAPHYYPC